MSSEVLYNMLVGVLSALLISAIFGVPKLIAFVVKKLTKSKGNEDNEDNDDNDE